MHLQHYFMHTTVIIIKAYVPPVYDSEVVTCAASINAKMMYFQTCIVLFLKVTILYSCCIDSRRSIIEIHW